MTPLFRRLLAIGIFFTVASLVSNCKSDSNQSGSPSLDLYFPPSNALTTESELRVTGRATNGLKTDSIRVNGISVEPTDDTGRWEVVVPITPGRNSIIIKAEDRDGESLPDLPSVEVVLYDPSVKLDFPFGLDIDTDHDLALVTNINSQSLIAVDLKYGTRTVITGGGRGAGPEIKAPVAVSFDRDLNRAIVVDIELGALVSVDPESGDR